MAQPVWITPSGSLGTIPEGIFYQIPLQAYEPDVSAKVYYQIIAGELPAGIQCEANGLIAGVPKAIAIVQGVPLEVNKDVVSKFAVRAYTIKTVAGQIVIDRLTDRTFTLTVTGPDAPQFITPAGNLASYYDGTIMPDLQIEYTDPDPNETVIVRLVSGSLPPGTTISRSGIISGFIDVNAQVEATAGYSRDGQGFEQYPYDFSTRSTDATYQFTLEVTDGTLNNLRTFNITVYSQNDLTADNTTITADNTFITADATPVRTPIIITPQGLIGTVRSDNYFAFQFVGLDLDGDQFAFEMTGSIPGLMLDTGTGWLYGYIPDLGLTELTFDFELRVYKVNEPSYISAPYYYSLVVNGPVNSDITWLTSSDLGTINNGATSTLYVRAVSRAGLNLQYQLLPGSNSSLPQGLQLLPSGNIAGRCSFDTFALDGGATTFDIDSRNRTDAPTTFDLKFTFTVQVYSLNEVVNFTKTFWITVVRAYNEPYENLYIQAMPPLDDRSVLESLLQSPQIFPPELIYRNDDPNFGVATHVIYQHAFGLTAATLDDYYSSLYENHYWKNLVLGEIEVAEARNSTGQVIYEVVYSRVIDNLLNDAGQSVDKSVNLPYTIELDNYTQVSTVYPNSLINMRDQVIDTVGQIGNILPTWMISKQSNGRVLGFTPAWVIAYVVPGEGQRVAYNIRTQFGDQLNQIDFEVDRYELDRLLTHNWNPQISTWNITGISGNGIVTTATFNTHSIEFAIGDPVKINGCQPTAFNGTYYIISVNATQITYNSIVTGTGTVNGTISTVPNWIPQPATLTTFDMDTHYQLPNDDSSLIFFGGTGYAINDQILILGSQLGGTDTINDVIITVQQIDIYGTIQQALAQGFGPINGSGEVYTNIIGTNISGTGVGAMWDLVVSNNIPTIFDGGSIQFVAPVDMYSNTTAYDKYLVFPKRDILE